MSHDTPGITEEPSAAGGRSESGPEGPGPGSAGTGGGPGRFRLLVLRLLALSRPDDLCVLVFGITVLLLLPTLGRSFHWELFWIFIKPIVYWFTALLLPLILILLMQDRYNVKRSSSRFISGFLSFVRDFIPYLICVVIYLNLADIVTLVSPQDRDLLLIRIDDALFGVQPSQWLEQFSTPWRDEWMHFTYEIFGWYPVTLGVFFLARGQRRAFRDLLLAIILSSYIGYLGYVTVPAIGPRYHLEYTVDLRGRFFAAIEWAMKNSLYIPRDCFPSLHTANTLIVLGMAWRYGKGLFWWYLPLGASTIVATLYLRYHYGIDLIAGALLAWAVTWISPLWNDRWDRWTEGLRARTRGTS